MRKSGKPDLRGREGNRVAPSCAVDIDACHHCIPPLATSRMATRTIVFDLDGTLVDTAPDLIGSLNVLLARERLAPITLNEGRGMIGGGVRRLIERGLATQGRAFTA